MPLKDYRFSDKDYSKMLINVHALGDTADVYKHFEATLSAHEIFKPWYIEEQGGTAAERQEKYRKANLAKFKSIDISNNQAIRFIAYFYDPDSPFKQIAEYKERKIVCAEKAKFKLDEKGNFTEPYQKILNGQNVTVNLMAIHYLRFFRNTTYTTLRITMERYYNEVLSDGDVAEIKSSSNFIDSLTKAFLGQEKEDQERYLNPVLYGVIDNDLIEIEKLRPERILQKLIEWQ